jgi:hypothetical protein
MWWRHTAGSGRSRVALGPSSPGPPRRVCREDELHASRCPVPLDKLNSHGVMAMEALHPQFRQPKFASSTARRIVSHSLSLALRVCRLTGIAANNNRASRMEKHTDPSRGGAGDMTMGCLASPESLNVTTRAWTNRARSAGRRWKPGYSEKYTAQDDAGERRCQAL